MKLVAFAILRLFLLGAYAPASAASLTCEGPKFQFRPFEVTTPWS